ncbi:hypothetical protein CFP56_004819 [Quercus suber]|uniref:Uncharacterized protein n=1 Tax=Quercus suber TaxID=58331 RepID=A0AAW0M8Y1_QUESU
MMVNEDEVMSKLNQLQFGFLSFGQFYYQDAITVTTKVVVAPLTFWEKGRKWQDDSIEKILLIILPMMGLSYTGCYNTKVEAEEDIEDENTKTVKTRMMMMMMMMRWKMKNFADDRYRIINPNDGGMRLAHNFNNASL